jgi:hypothetical protein
MKKSICFILLEGMVVLGAAYAFGHVAATSTQPTTINGHHPALGWMRTEFQLTPAQFARMREVHEGYQPKCLEMCRIIDAKHTEIQMLLAETNVVTPQIKQKRAIWQKRPGKKPIAWTSCWAAALPFDLVTNGKPCKGAAAKNPAAHKKAHPPTPRPGEPSGTIYRI